MLEYDFVICYKKGIDKTAADALSRNVITTPTDKFIATMSDDSGDIISAQDNVVILFKMSRHSSRRVLYLAIRSVTVTRLRGQERTVS